MFFFFYTSGVVHKSPVTYLFLDFSRLLFLDFLRFILENLSWESVWVDSRHVFCPFSLAGYRLSVCNSNLMPVSCSWSHFVHSFTALRNLIITAKMKPCEVGTYVHINSHVIPRCMLKSMIYHFPNTLDFSFIFWRYVDGKVCLREW